MTFEQLENMPVGFLPILNMAICISTCLMSKPPYSDLFPLVSGDLRELYRYFMGDYPDFSSRLDPEPEEKQV